MPKGWGGASLVPELRIRHRRRSDPFTPRPRGGRGNRACASRPAGAVPQSLLVAPRTPFPSHFLNVTSAYLGEGALLDANSAAQAQRASLGLWEM